MTTTYEIDHTYRNERTGIVFNVDQVFTSGGETIVDYTVVDGPHSIGCKAQKRPFHDSDRYTDVTNEPAKHYFTHAEAQSFALDRKVDSRTARDFGDWVVAVQSAYPDTLETQWDDFCQARFEEANDI